MEKAAYLFDVRPAAEYRAYHLPGSINVPLDEVRRVPDIVPDKDARVCLYCETGKHSGCARTVLKYLGYTDVHNLGSVAEAERVFFADLLME